MKNSVSESKFRMKNYMVLSAILMVGLFLSSYTGRLRSYNSTIYALNYRYGFISRAFIGTIYSVVDALFPANMISYDMAVKFTLVVTIGFLAYYLWFLYMILKKIPSDYQRITAYLGVVLNIFLTSTFAGDFNFGRVDMYMIAISMLGTLLFVYEKAEFLVIPLTIIGMLIHQGYIFMYLNIMMIFVVYKFFKNDKKRVYYGIIFVCCAVAALGLIFYFELFSHSSGTDIWNEVVANATALSLDGEYHETLLAHEILGVDLGETEWDLHLINFVEFPIFLLLWIPYLTRSFRLGKNCVKVCKNMCDKVLYVLIIAGVLTMLPDFLIKIDYGRWVLTVIVYYIVVLMALFAMKDPIVSDVLPAMVKKEKETNDNWLLLLIYPILFIPLWDVHISKTLTSIWSELNDVFIHRW